MWKMQEETGLVISCSFLSCCSLGYEHGQSERETKDAEHFCQKDLPRACGLQLSNVQYANNNFLNQLISSNMSIL